MDQQPRPQSSGSSANDAALGLLMTELRGLKNEVEGLRRVLEITRKLSSILEVDRLLDAILDEAINLTSAKRGLFLSLVNGNLKTLLGRGSDQESLKAEASRVSETLARRCLEENRAIPYDNLGDSAEFREVRSIQALSLYSAVCVPLRERGKATGVLYLDSPTPGLRTTPQELLLLEAFASQAAVSLLNARLMKQSEESRLLLARENKNLRDEVGSHIGLAEIVGQSRVMQGLYAKIRLLKDAQVPVLILGESGTGKELVARALHYEGVYRQGPFVPVNCAGLPGDLLDSLMFGHRKGAFTGAVADMPGFVEQSDGGTLFLDEIGDMPVTLQVKLLRFLESGEFRRVGEVDLRKAHARVLSATNQDLARMVQARSFREDLYFRLAGACLEIPPLRERREDIPLLIEHFYSQAAGALPRTIAGMTASARAFLIGLPWPGNVRQLRQTIEAACAMVPEGEPVDTEHLKMVSPRRGVFPPASAEAAESASACGSSLDPALDSPDEAPGAAGKSSGERDLLESILHRHDWNITRAAQEIGISRQHLYNRMRMFDLRRP